MTTRVPVQIGRKSDRAQAPSDSVERLINGYLESVPQGKEASPIYGTPGMRGLVGATNAGAIRMLHTMAGRLFFIAGNSLTEVVYGAPNAPRGELPGTVARGGIDPGQIVDVADDGTTLSIVNPQTGKIWLYDDANGCRQVSDSDALPAVSVEWIDDYFIYGELGGDRYFISDLGNPSSFNALNFGAAYWKPGAIEKLIVLEKSVYIFKAKSVEAAYDTGDTTTFVFAPRPDVHIPIGLIGNSAATSTNQTIYWLADDLTVRRLDGVTPTRVSTFAIERLIRGAPEVGQAGWSDPSKTIVTSHVWRGHLFVVFNNPDGCVVFDQATNLWHERKSYSISGWAYATYAYWMGHHVFGDYTTGILTTAEPDEYTENGNPLIFDATFPFIYQQNQAFIMHRMSMVMDTGRVALGLNPKVQIAYTKDGYLYGDWKSRLMGNTGAYRQQIDLPGCGRVRSVAARVRISDPVPRALLSAYGEIEVLEG